MSSLKPRFTVLAALCSLAAISAPGPVHGTYIHTDMDSSAPGSISQSASMMSLSASMSQPTSVSNQSHARTTSSSEQSSAGKPAQALDARSLAVMRAAARKDSKKFKTVGYGNGRGRKPHKGRTASWNTLNPILSLSEWFGDRTRPSKSTNRDLNDSLPPLLQQANTVRGHDEARAKAESKEDEDEDGFVYVHPRSFSTFASRWNKRYATQDQNKDQDHEPVDEHRRSSVIIPNKDEGGLYVLSSDHGSQELGKRKRNEDVATVGADNDRYNSRPFVQQKRDDGGVPGTVDIMSAVYGSDKGVRIASLVLDVANSTDGNSTSNFVLNASSTNQTQVYLVKAPLPASHSVSTTSDASPDSGLNTGDIPVTLQLPIFDSAQASMVRYCTTFDPSPSGGEPLTVEPCFQWSTTPSSGVNTTQTHKSQAFAFNEDSGVVRPMWFDGEDDGSRSSAEDTGHGNGDSESGNDDATVANQDPETPVGENVASITSLRARDGMANSTAPATPSANSTMATGAKNVTLVFTPVTPEVSPQQQTAPEANAVGGVSSSSAVAGTATVTATATVTDTLASAAAAMSSSSASNSISALTASASSVSAAGVGSTQAMTSTTTTGMATTDSSASSVTSSPVVSTSAFVVSSSAVPAADIESTSVAGVLSTTAPDPPTATVSGSSSSVATATASLSAADISSTTATTTDTSVGSVTTTVTVISTSTTMMASGSFTPVSVADVQSNVVMSSTVTDTTTTIVTAAPSTQPTSVAAVADVQSALLVSTTSGVSTSSTAPTSVSSVSAADVESSTSATMITSSDIPTAPSSSMSSSIPTAADVESTPVASMVSSSSSTVATYPASSMATVPSLASPSPLSAQDAGVSSTSAVMTTPSPTAPTSTPTALPPSTSVNAEVVASIIADAQEPGDSSTTVSSSSSTMDTYMPTPSSTVMMVAGDPPSSSSAAGDMSSTSSAAPSTSMTPASTAPYEWMFTPDSPL